MSITTFWSPNQGAVAQVETYTFSAPNAIGNTYNATMNGKTITYRSVSGDTAATAASGLQALLSVATGIPAEFTEITFAITTSGVMTATAVTPGTPFANVPGTSAGLVLSTGNGLSNGITTAHTTPNASPSDANDPQNWLRINVSVTPPSNSRGIPVNGDDVVVSDTSIPILWNLDQLSGVQFNTYTRWQSFTGGIGLPENNANGYKEWRATYFKFSGPQGSIPAGGLAMLLGYGPGSGPSRERYDVGSQPVTMTLLAAGSAADQFNVRFIGYHTANTFSVMPGTSLGIATTAGETSKMTSSTVDGGTISVGAGVVWTAASTLTINSGAATLNAAPATINMSNGARLTITTDSLTWATITAQNSCLINFLAGGIVTTLTLTTGSVLDKSSDPRSLVITNSTMDGDTCQIRDPLNVITFTNATSVKQSVNAGPIIFTGTRTVKVT